MAEIRARCVPVRKHAEFSIELWCIIREKNIRRPRKDFESVTSLGRGASRIATSLSSLGYKPSVSILCQKKKLRMIEKTCTRLCLA